MLGGLEFRTLARRLAGRFGAALIGFIQAGAGAVLTDVLTELRRHKVRAKHFGTDRAAIQAAIDYVYGIGGGTVLIDRNTTFNVTDTHPTKTFTTPGDDGTLSNVIYGANIAEETVYQMPVGIWLKEGVTLEFEDETAEIVGPWSYATTSTIDRNQVIGILISSSAAAANPKSTALTANIIGRGSISGFMMNVVAEGILATSRFEFASSRSAFPFIAQGADNCEFDIETPYCKAGVIIGGQWLTRSNTTSATYLPTKPAGFGGGSTYPAGDVYLIGWCDNCRFSSNMQRPDLAGGPSVAYGAWETSIDSFFDTYFFKTGSNGRLGGATPNPAALTAFPGVVGMGMQVFSRYNRPVGTPKFRNMKNYGLIRSPIYCEAAYMMEVGARAYFENVGMIAGNSFGVVINDPYGTPGTAVGAFVRGSGVGLTAKNIFGFNSGLYKSINFNGKISTEACYLNSETDLYNNYNDFLQNSRPETITIGVLQNINAKEGKHTWAGPLAAADIATIDCSNLGLGNTVAGFLEILLVSNEGTIEGYANAFYRLPIIIANSNGATLNSQGGAAPAHAYATSVNAGVSALTATFAVTIAGTTAHVTVTPAGAGVSPPTKAIAFWRIELRGANQTPITVA